MATPFEIFSRFIDDLAALSPIFSAAIGARGRDSDWDDLSTEGEESKVELARSVVSKLSEQLDDPDPDQRLAAHVVTEAGRERLGDEFDLEESHPRVLGSGAMGLDLVKRVVAGEFDS